MIWIELKIDDIIIVMSKVPTNFEPYMDELRYWNHGDNPAFKKFMKIGMENTRGKRMIDHRTHVLDKGIRYLTLHLESPGPEILTTSFKEISKQTPSRDHLQSGSSVQCFCSVPALSQDD